MKAKLEEIIYTYIDKIIPAIFVLTIGLCWLMWCLWWYCYSMIPLYCLPIIMVVGVGSIGALWYKYLE